MGRVLLLHYTSRDSIALYFVCMYYVTNIDIEEYVWFLAMCIDKFRYCATIGFILSQTGLFDVFSWARDRCFLLLVVIKFIAFYGCINNRDKTSSSVSELVNCSVFLANHLYKKPILLQVLSI